MQEVLKQIKLDYLAKLKEKKNEIEQQKQVMIEQRFAEKKQALETETQALDEALALFIQQRQEKLNEEIAAKRKEVADKKANIEVNARAMAEAEVEAEAEAILLVADMTQTIWLIFTQNMRHRDRDSWKKHTIGQKIISIMLLMNREDCWSRTTMRQEML